MTSLLVTGGGGDHRLPVTGNLITGSVSATGGNSPTTYLLLTTTASTGSGKIVTGKSSSHIAPKRSDDDGDGSSNSSNSGLRAKRKIRFTAASAASSAGEKHSAPPAVARRNERERNRVRQVNLGFATLRQHVPNGTKAKKMSKVETLRSAVQYIKQLQQLLNETGHSESDENSLPSFDEVQISSAAGTTQVGSQYGHHRHHHQSHIGMQGQTDAFSTMNLGVTSPPCSAASSPTPSLGSDASSPYDSLSPEDEELLDFTSWLS